MTTRGIVIIALLIAAAFGSWYLARTNTTDAGGAVERDLAYRGYYLKSARILGTGPNGNLLYEIEAVRAEQREDESIEFSDVRIAYSPDSDVPWVVDADKATIYPNQEKVLLEGHVRAVSERGFSGDETEIRTQVLELDPENFIAETNERVQIRIGARSLTGTGMLASLNDNRVEIRSNVSGRFVP
ncbi:MAG: LPS export ABC transporter periplasmic protein LptC [Woeseiaceae bacterium]|nr:LPS export ABC transporter periplasmic protein LptC [Woeseiaceae bacterium]